MTPATARAMHRRQLDAHGETITLRRYAGTGAGRTHADDTARARVTGYQPQEIVGPIQVGDRKVIVMAEDVTEPPRASSASAVIIRGRELAIVGVDDNTRRIAAELIAYELQVRG